jgi:protocatechuate 3,4-dioxygenase beta subunit
MEFDPKLFDRRVFAAGLAAAAGLGPACALAAERSGRTPTTQKDWDAVFRSDAAGALTCVAATPMTEGPFYYESSLQRRAIAEKHPGVPLRLGVTLGGLSQQQGRCFPLAGVVVDVWHASAEGLYSNVGKDLQPVDTAGQTFMRGHQITDQNGYVEFDTIVPGWEIVAGRPGVPGAPAAVPASRTTHIHVKAFHDREVLTTQLFFPDSLLDQLYADVEPYRSYRLLIAPGLDRPYPRIRNAQDRFYQEAKATPMTVRKVNGVLTAKAALGVLSQGDRGFRTLWR